MTREEIENSMTLKDAIEVFKSTNAYGTMDIAKSVILKALEQKPVLDKLRAEIVDITKCPYGTQCLGANCPSNTDCMICGDHVLEIIDKYRTESEADE